MIFGYNTDVRSGDTVYHVQTEDRGDKNPVIDSVIYVKGRIIDRHRTPYVPGEQTAEELQEAVKQQHRTLVESIRSGSYQPPAEHAVATTADGAQERQEPAGAASTADWNELDSETEPDFETCNLELMNAPEIEANDGLLFRLKITEPYSGRPIAQASVRALLRDELGGEILQEATASHEGIAELRFASPPGGKATVLFQATGARSSELLSFKLRRAGE